MEGETIKVIDKIKQAYKERVDAEVEPCLLLINNLHERLLFTEDTIPKPESVEDYIMEVFQCELLVTKLKTEPEFFGKHPHLDLPF